MKTADDDDDFNSDNQEAGTDQGRHEVLRKVLDTRLRAENSLITYPLSKYDHVIDIERRIEIVDRIIVRVKLCVKSAAFKDIWMYAEGVSVLERHCLTLLLLIKKKERKALLEGLSNIKSARASQDRHSGKALAALAGTLYSRNARHNLYFLNQLELVAFAHELLFRRMKSIQWGEEPRFTPFPSLVRTYLQTLWMKHPDKYEYVQDLVENNTHIFTVLLDDLLSSHVDKARKTTLLYSLHRIKNFDRLRLKRLEKLLRILKKYNAKMTKVHLMDFMRKVNTVRPKDSLLYVLHGVFTYYHLLGLQEGFNKIKLDTAISTKDEKDKRAGLNILRSLFDKKVKESSRAIPVRSFFPIKEVTDKTDAGNTLLSSLKTALKKQLTNTFNDLRYFGVPSLLTEVEEEHNVVEKVEHRLKVVKYRGVELLESTLYSIVQRRLARPFRKLLDLRREQENRKDHVFDIIKAPFFRVLFQGFNEIREYAKKVRDQRLASHREAFSTLDSLFKNKYNQAFSQVKTLMIELQVLSVTDSTNANKLMFSVKDMMNTSGNLSGCWEEVARMSTSGVKNNGSNRFIPRESSPEILKSMSPMKAVERASVVSKNTTNTSSKITESSAQKKTSANKIVESGASTNVGNTSILNTNTQKTTKIVTEQASTANKQSLNRAGNTSILNNQQILKTEEKKLSPGKITAVRRVEEEYSDQAGYGQGESGGRNGATTTGKSTLKATTVISTKKEVSSGGVNNSKANSSQMASQVGNRVATGVSSGDMSYDSGNYQSVTSKKVTSEYSSSGVSKGGSGYESQRKQVMEEFKQGGSGAGTSSTVIKKSVRVESSGTPNFEEEQRYAMEYQRGGRAVSPSILNQQTTTVRSGSRGKK